MTFRFNPRAFAPKEFGSTFNAANTSAFVPSQFTNKFDSNDLNFNPNLDTSNISAPQNIGFGENGTQLFGPNGSGFDGIDLDTTSDGFSNFDLARLGIGALRAGGGIFDSFTRRKNLKLARDAFNFQKDAFNKNFALSKAGFDNQVTTVNNRINDQNAFKTAQGRTDLAKLVV